MTGPPRTSRATKAAKRDGTRAPLLARFRPFPNPLRVFANCVLFNVAYPLRGRPFAPRAMCLYVTYRCNMRCQMCGIWRLPTPEKSTEWTLPELEQILNQGPLSRLEFVNLNGGEPNLRAELVEIAEMLLARLPRLRNLTLNTNGLPSERCVENCRRILAHCQRRGVRFGVSVSLHRLGPAYDEVAGVPDAYRKVKATIDSLRELRGERGFYLSTNCVLTPSTLPDAEAMLQWGADEGVPVNFTVAEARERFNNLDAVDDVTFSDDEQRRRLVAFLRRLSHERALVGHHAIRYRELAEMIGSGRPRTLACHYALAGFILGFDGSVFYCKKSAPIGSTRERPVSEILFDPANLAYRQRALIRGACASCLPNTFNSIEMQKNLLRVLATLR